MVKSIFTRILLAVDDTKCSEKAITYAKDIVNRLQPHLAIITVVPPTSPSTYGSDPILGQQPVVVPEISGIQLEGALEYLKEVSKNFETSAKDVTLFNKIGSVRDEILTTAEEWGCDLIVMGSNGRTGFNHLLSGSVSESVIRKAKCPVLVIPGNCD
ncbi:MAG TPA: universal stress protein [Sphingobacterium sp.]|nr:universal stress protein [Sphingobacterium sp.]